MMGWLSLVGAGVSAIAQSEQGHESQAAANAQANDVEYNATASASKLRKLAMQSRGSARAALAASGVDVNSGTSDVIDEDITRNSEADAYNIILNGKQQANAIRKSGRVAASAGDINATSSLASGLGNYYSNWKKSVAATNYGVT